MRLSETLELLVNCKVNCKFLQGGQQESQGGFKAQWIFRGCTIWIYPVTLINWNPLINHVEAAEPFQENWV
jgi:hypothetical protein